jgi:hypothetical protein
VSGSTLPTIITTAGLQPQPPQSLNTQLINLATATNPGLTVLPAGLIEDISSTATAGLVIIDQARVETVNSLTPYGANAFILNQQGQMFGVPPGQTVNTSVYIVFTQTGGTNFIISPGFTVSDGVNQYVVPASGGGTTGNTGQSLPIYVVATQQGSWQVLPNTVTTIVTSLPTGITLTVTNPLAGTPAAGPETETNYRARVLTGQLATSIGVPAFVKTLVGNISGVNSALVSVLINQSGQYEVVVGGNGDPGQIAFALYQSIPNIGLLSGSVMAIDAITQATNAQVTTVLNHGYLATQAVTFSGIEGMTELNTGNYTVETVVDEKNFTINANSTGYTPYSGGGQVLPNLRNVTITIDDYPNSYPMTFVIPPQQTVNIVVLWNTTVPGYVSGPVFNQLAQAALVNYVNNLPVGAPMNEFVMATVVQQATVSVLATPLLTRLIFSVSINGISTSPETGTGIIAGDPESYYFATTATVSVSQG